MMAVAIPMADPQLEFRWLPDPGFLIRGFLIQGFRRIPPCTPPRLAPPSAGQACRLAGGEACGGCVDVAGIASVLAM